MFSRKRMKPATEPGGTWLYLVRHGATEANERIPYVLQGSAIDLSLSARGERQARSVASFLKRFPISHVYSSTMRRARQTAESIGTELGLAPKAVANLHECDVGAWEGLDWDTIAEKHPEEHRRFVENPAESPYLGGESYGQVLERAWPVMERLLAAHAGESIVIVSHNVVNRALLARLLGLELWRAPGISQGNCCVNLIKSANGRHTLVTLNALFHFEAPPG